MKVALRRGRYTDYGLPYVFQESKLVRQRFLLKAPHLSLFLEQSVNIKARLAKRIFSDLQYKKWQTNHNDMAVDMVLKNRIRL